MSTRIVQLENGPRRHAALVQEPDLHLLNAPSYYQIVQESLRSRLPVTTVLKAARSGETVDYDAVYNRKSEWKLLPPLTHKDTAHCIISGTGLTHLGSAKNRNAMHDAAAQKQETLTDSMKMFQWGLERGRPAAGEVGIAPEWFFKGSGANLRAANEDLDIPPYAEDGGEEAEIVGLYVIDSKGNPIRVGMAQGNEFSDHVFEKKNYLNLAGSKMRTCSVGPELVVDPDFSMVPGEVSIIREGRSIWSKQIATGEKEMSHSLANMEHHHFKFEAHRVPGDVHIHFFGTSALSFGEGVRLGQGDIMQIQFAGFGRALRNPVRLWQRPEKLVHVIPVA